jgi:hypothetical protein
MFVDTLNRIRQQYLKLRAGSSLWTGAADSPHLGSMTQQITGSIAVILPGIAVAGPAPPHSYVGVAQNLVEGIKVLVAAESPPPVALAMLCAHALECSLKAYLSRDGNDARLMNPAIRHNIGALWALASREGLAVPEIAPPWVCGLSDLHDKPYDLRYATRFQFLVLPAAGLMAAGVTDLLQLVRINL